jgi:hypothetical protein
MSDEAPNWDKLAEMDPILDLMQGAGIPLTREHYISTKYGKPGSMDYPEEWTQEHEDDLPHPFQR